MEKPQIKFKGPENEFVSNKLKPEDKINKFGLTSGRFDNSTLGKSAEKEIKKAKKLQRSDMKSEDWTKFDFYSDDWCENMLQNPPEGVFKISYENYNNLSVEDFREKYEKLNKPVIIRGGTANWGANKNWTFEVRD